VRACSPPAPPAGSLQPLTAPPDRDADQGCIDWAQLRFVVSSENLRAQESPFADAQVGGPARRSDRRGREAAARTRCLRTAAARAGTRAPCAHTNQNGRPLLPCAQVVEVNTGGLVFFCFLRQDSNLSPLRQASASAAAAAAATAAAYDAQGSDAGAAPPTPPPSVAAPALPASAASSASHFDASAASATGPACAAAAAPSEQAQAQQAATAAAAQAAAAQAAVEQYLQGAVDGPGSSSDSHNSELATEPPGPAALRLEATREAAAAAAAASYPSTPLGDARPSARGLEPEALAQPQPGTSGEAGAVGSGPCWAGGVRLGPCLAQHLEQRTARRPCALPRPRPPQPARPAVHLGPPRPRRPPARARGRAQGRHQPAGGAGGAVCQRADAIPGHRSARVPHHPPGAARAAPGGA
jgi:hypothetical protein